MLRIGWVMIRNYGDVQRVRPSDHAGEHENIFLAKFATRSPRTAPLTTLLDSPFNFITQGMRRARIKEIAAAQVFHAMLTSVDDDGACISRIVMRTHRSIVA